MPNVANFALVLIRKTQNLGIYNMISKCTKLLHDALCDAQKGMH